MLWNLIKLKEREPLLLFNLVVHPLKNKKILYRNEEFLILNVFKEWNEGWYLSAELRCLSHHNYDKHYIKVPIININSENPEILEKIQNLNLTLSS